MNITVRETDDKKFGVFIEEHCIGESKYRFDADFHKNMLDKALEEEYNRGYDRGVVDGFSDAEGHNNSL